ncbi:lytic transglycosylase domain-containing protein [Marinivivus vitaminiproducens]|uniref:lytic transglycosylase domain-containing protein n=1 Tax=Marinivivus vitaminiproducens TaxID=3035935 RepID=UPI0027A60532|nr:transglycosylase SLT domain-containing protein [Geminicoccaceae bacterium SCSIO 64248]
MRVFVLAVLITLALVPEAVASDGRRCADAVLRAEGRYGLPRGLLQAIALTETGRRIEGELTAWPWAINVEGAGHWFDGRTQAQSHVARLLAQGVRSIDVGCMQINLRWHPDAFAGLDEAFDPSANAAYAARYLVALHAETGDWLSAAGRYHSADPTRAQGYRERVARNWEAVIERPDAVILPEAPGRIAYAAADAPIAGGRGPLLAGALGRALVEPGSGPARALVPMALDHDLIALPAASGGIWRRP